MRGCADAIRVSGFSSQTEPAFSLPVAVPKPHPPNARPSRSGTGAQFFPMKETRSDLELECNFSGLPKEKIKTACMYEYMRECQALRDALGKDGDIAPYLDVLSRECKADCPKRYVLQESSDLNRTAGAQFRIYCPHCQKYGILPAQRRVLPLFVRDNFSGGEKYRFAFALLKAGFPKPWKQRKSNVQKELVVPISEWEKEHKKSHPPVVIEDASPVPDLEREAEESRAGRLGIRIWRLEPSNPELLRRGQQSGRDHFYGFIRIDRAYNQSDAVEAFKKEYERRWAKTKRGGAPHWRNLLNQLSVMRIWNLESNRCERLTLVAKFCGYQGCKDEVKAYKERCKDGRGDEQMSNAAKAEISGARADARTFFQKLFPGEEPLSYRVSENEKS